MKYPKYEKYKDTGIEWLGFVPVEWKLKRLKFLTIESLKYGANVAAELDDPDLPRYVRITDVDSNGNLKDDTFRSIEKDVALPYLLKNGDLLFARSGATVGKTFIYNESWGEAAYAGYLIKASLKINEINPKLIYYYTKSHAYSKWIESITIQSTIQNVSAEKYASLWFTIPSSHGEQQSIANFLDRETARIDTLIEKKQKFIETLKEKRIAIISRAVTKGLNPEVPMKDSGIEWLGNVPEHWEVKRLKYQVLKVGSGVTPSGGATVYEDEGIPLIRSQNIYSNRFKLDDIAFITEGIHNSMSNSKVKNGDVLLNITGASLGRSFYMVDTFKEANVNQHVCIIRPNQSKVNTQFLHLLIISDAGQAQIWYDQTGSGREGLNFVSIKNFFFAFPPTLQEQNKIVETTSKETEKIDLLIIKTEAAIDKLKEYKTALISAAVTGKIKVA
jgi:type I restriction enzyme S subunit